MLSRCTSAFEAEALAAMEGIRLTIEWAHAPIVLESYCARLVQALQGRQIDRSEIGNTIMEAQEMMRLLQEVNIVQVKREQNGVAHELAQLARRNVHTAVWRWQAPACVAELLDRDCNSSIFP
ncbi:hypothetical protein QOZ80_6BG0484370 [Eleusine coracana subsp. coracana]|nr:hypothetical protein QOZ80_6BG0484370 [Eleusine coracana subsp. coracana]